MEKKLNKRISLWPRSEVFIFGVFPMQPHPRLTVNNIKRLITYAKGKSNGSPTQLKYGIWKHVACNKLNFTEEDAWTYFEACLVMACPKMEYLLEMESILAKTCNVVETENTRLQQSLDLNTFAIFLYLNQINKLSLRSSAASISGEWPGSPSKSMDSLPTWSAIRLVKNTSVQYQLQFIRDYLLEILEILSDLVPTGRDLTVVKGNDKCIHVCALDALSFIFEGSIDSMSSIKSFRDLIFDSLCISHVGYDKLTKTFSVPCLHSWMRANLCQCPFSVESCMLNGVQWAGVENTTFQSTKSPKRQQKIYTNVQQLPSSNSFRGNKIIASEMLHKQFIARASRFLKFSTVRLRRAISSFIYLLVPLRCVALDRCRKSTIVLGPIECTLMLTDCEDCLIIAAARRVVIWSSRNCILHLLCATRPLLLQPTLASTGAGTNESQSCPPSPPMGIARGGSHLGNENITFAPFHTTYPELRHHLDKAALDPTVNLWDKPLLFGNNFWRSSPRKCQSNGVWSLLPPDNFFPFNIPLAPLLTNEASGTVWKQKACDVCRGVVVDCDHNDGNRNSGSDNSVEDKAPLCVPLPPVYAKAVNMRHAAYRNWQKIIQVSLP